LHTTPFVNDVALTGPYLLSTRNIKPQKFPLYARNYIKSEL